MNSRRDETDTNSGAASNLSDALSGALSGITFLALPPSSDNRLAGSAGAGITVIQPTQRRFDALRASLAEIAPSGSCYAIVELSTQTLVFRLNPPASQHKQKL